MAPRLLTSPQAAERLGLPVQALYKLRDADEGLAITQTGLLVGYQVEDIAAYERCEMLALVEQVLATARPLPLIRAMAQLLRSPPPEEGLPVPAPNPRPSPKPLTSASPATYDRPATAPPNTPAVSPPTPQKPTTVTSAPPATSAWFLVRSKPRQESVALTQLARQGYESYLPLFATEKLVRRKSTVVQEPMFARYLFVRLDTTGQGQSWSPIRSTVGVSELVSFGTITVAHADALLKATPPEQRTDFKPTERDKQLAPIEQIVKLEKEMSQVQTQYKDAEENYGSDLLNLVVAKGYLTKLLGNDAVKSYITRHEPEILEHFELVVNTVSMEEAVQQQLEADGEFEDPPEEEAPTQ